LNVLDLREDRIKQIIDRTMTISSKI